MNLNSYRQPRRPWLCPSLVLSCALGVLAGPWSAGGARAQDLIITDDTVMSQGTYAYDNVVVQDGATLTFESDLVGGVGSTLQAQSITVELGAAISVTGQGYAAGAGPGAGAAGAYRAAGSGGGHGGQGGNSWGLNSTRTGGDAYGDIEAAASLGSGGGASGSGPGAGKGGGGLTLVVSGVVLVDGVIAADGTNGGANGDYAGGGGAGGSIFIQAASIEGSGVIRANGGAGGIGTYAKAGGGGGGHVVLDGVLDGPSVESYGGSGHQRGAAGTVWQPGERPALTVVNAGASSRVTPIAAMSARADLVIAGAATVLLDEAFQAFDVTVSGAASLSHAAGTTAFALDVAEELFVEAGSSIHGDGRGAAAGAGTAPGGTGMYRIGGGGGGHGGQGGNSSGHNGGRSGGGAYGALEVPDTLGSGGGTGGAVGGGAGGGRLVVTVAGEARVDGALSASGSGGGADGDHAGGGGAGGTLVLGAASITGSGVIRVNGGAGGNGTFADGGGGAGGRLVLVGPLDGPAIEAFGGTGAQRGAAGTIWRPNARPELRVINAGASPRFTPIADTSVACDLVIAGQANALLDGAFHALAASVSEGALLSHSGGVADFRLEVAEDLVIAAGATIHGNGRGHGVDGGAGAGSAGAYRAGGSGGGHGGQGGNSSGNDGSRTGGAGYGSIEAADTLGSGGGSSGHGSVGAGSGGGRLVLRVTGTLAVDGTIAADGTNGGATGDHAGGGGAGGTIDIVAAAVTGTGEIRANGGAGGIGSFARGGGGAGGRIVIDGLDAASGPAIAALGGSGAEHGAAGTLWLERLGAARPLLVVHNEGTASSRVTPLVDTSVRADVVIDGSARALLDELLNAWSLEVGDTATLSHSAGVVGFALDVSSDVVVEAGASIHGSGRGAAPGAGTAPGTAGEYRRGGGGGGHGGQGGNGTGANGSKTGGAAYGAIETPDALGSGGGMSGSGPGAGRGGGHLVIDVAGVLTVDGVIAADGASGGANGDYAGGGGAGGTIVIGAASVEGGGTIRANGGAGGNGGFADGGGGAGGRIVVSALAAGGPAIEAVGGTGAQRGAAGTKWLYVAGAEVPVVEVANGGASPRWTPILPTPTFTDLRVSGPTLAAIDETIAVRYAEVTGGAVLTHSPGVTTFLLDVAADFTLDGASAINVDARGYGSGSGEGAGGAGTYRVGGGGGGHGGKGGQGTGANGGASEGAATDVWTLPVLAGSGGGAADGTAGGAGGGVVVLAVGQVATIDGLVTANGGAGGNGGGNSVGGGGAGGTVRIVAGEVAGGGTVRASGGAGVSQSFAQSGGGGGGRVVVSADAVDGGVALVAVGGAGNRHGGAGTVVVVDAASGARALTVKNNGTYGARTPIAVGPVVLESLVVGGAAVFDLDAETSVGGDVSIAAATVVLDARLTADNAVIAEGSVLTHDGAQTGCELVVEGLLDLQVGGVIHGNGKGFPSAQGAGAGASGSYRVGSGGGGFGCAGGGGGGANGTRAGGAAYGTAEAPAALGSAAGKGQITAGGSGGGWLRVSAGAELRLDGAVTANGNNGGSVGGDDASGGGSGGTVALIAGVVSGSGQIAARGGNGVAVSFAHGGGGGGGRVAVRYGRDAFEGTVDVGGGSGYQAGCEGTVSWALTVAPIEDLAAAAGAGGDGQIDLTWTEPADIAPGTHTYEMRYAEAPITAATWGSALPVTPAVGAPVAAGGAMSHTATGLVGAKTYWFAVRVVDAEGIASALSNVAAAAASGDELAPSAIADVAATRGAGDGEVVLTWTAPADAGGGATAYEVRYRVGGGVFDWETATEVTAGVPAPSAAGETDSVTVTGLAVGTVVDFAVRARDGDGNLAEMSNIARADLVLPSVSLLAPEAAAEVSRTVRVAAQASDNVAVARVALLVDGAEVAESASGEDLGGGLYGYELVYDTRGLSDGAHGIGMRAYDAFGNASDATVSVTVVYAAPSQAVIVAPGDGQATASASLTVSGLSDLGTSVALEVNGAGWGAPVATAGAPGALGATFSFEGVTFAHGEHTLVAIATDSRDTAAAPSATVTIRVDLVAPDAVGDLVGDKGANNGEVALAWSATGDDGASGTAASYEVRYTTGTLDESTWDGATVVTLGLPAPGASGAAETLVVGGLSPSASYSFGVKVVDAVGHRSGLSNVVTVTPFDPELPTVAFAAPAAGSHHRAVATIVANANDNVSVSEVRLLVDEVEVASDDGAPWELSWNTAAASDGLHELELVAIDGEENEGRATLLVYADNTAPEVAIDQVTSPTLGPVALSYSASDNLTASGELVVVGPGGATPPFSYAEEGEYDVTLTVTDLAGNSASDAVAFAIDRSPPGRVEDLAATATAADAVTLGWTAPGDALSGVSAYALRMSDARREAGGDGRDGELVLDRELSLEPAATTLVGSVDAGDELLAVASTVGFRPGDEVLLLAAQCDEGAAGDAGRHTFGRAAPLRVAAVSLGLLALDGPVGEAFDGAACTVVVQVVPSFSRVVIMSGGVLTTAPWDGAGGGYLALRARDGVVVQEGGVIDVSGRGFRGHAHECVQRVNGLQGEGELRAESERAPTASTSGGGGGEGDLFVTAGFESSGGGGGGHATDGLAGEDFGFQPGGDGGMDVGEASLETAHLGGAGGQGGADRKGGSPGGGGAGGGVLLLGTSSLSLAGELVADGAGGGDGCNGCGGCAGSGCGMSGGGGGAGGTIHIVAGSVEDLGGSVSARGGAGGVSSGCAAAGGLGAPGRIRVDAEAGVAATSTPPAWRDSIVGFPWDEALPVPATAPAPAPEGTPESLAVSGLEAGKTLFFALRSENGVGLASATSVVAARDASAPAVAIVSPAADAEIARPVVIVAEVSDDVAVSEVVFAIDDVVVATLTAPPWQLAWDVRAESEGAHALSVTARDETGLESSDAIDVTVATTAPLAPEITLPRDGALLVEALTDVRGVAEPGVGVELFVNDVSAGSVTTSAVTTTSLEAEHLANHRDGCALVPAGDALGLAASAPLCIIESNWLDVPAGATHLFEIGGAWTGAAITFEVLTISGADWIAVAPRDAPIPVTDLIKVRATLAPSIPESTLDRVDLAWLGVGSGVAGAARFALSAVTLGEGDNTLFARATDAEGTSADSPTITVVVDSEAPGAPADLVATALLDGFVHLGWSAPAGETPASYAVYRDDAPIASLDGLTPIATALTDLELIDLPPADGAYHYVVVAHDSAGNASPPSASASAISDRAAPAAALALTPASPLGPGTIALVLTPSEPLVSAPLLKITWPGGWGTTTVTLAAGPDDTWTGAFDVLADQPNGMALFAFTGQDLIGHVGTAITAGATFAVDTHGPSASIALAPASPLAAGDATVTLTLDEPAPGGVTLSFTPTGGTATPVPVTADDALHWSGTLTITNDTGDGPATFAYSAVDAAGNTGTTLTAGATFHVLTTPPAPPSAFTAEKQPGSAVSLTWTASPSAAVVGYRLYRAPTSFAAPGDATFVAQLAATAALDQPPTNGTWYYAATAVDAAGNESALSNLASVEADPPPPENVTSLTASDASSTHITLTWTPSANTSGALAGYRAYRDGALVATLAPAATTHTFASLQPASAYTLEITSFDTWNRESLGASLVAYTWLPNPATVTVTPHDASAEVTWSPVAPSANLIHYAVFTAPSELTDITGLTPAVINPTGTKATLTGLENGVRVCFAVAAFNKSGFANPSVTSHCTTPSDVDGPPAPATLLVTAATATSLSLAWPASAGQDVAGYRVHVDQALAATTTSAATSATLTGLAPAGAYAITVAAFDYLDNVGPAAAVTGYTLMPHPAFTATGHDKSIALTWVAPTPAANVAGYRIYVRPTPFTTTTGLTPTATATAAELSQTIAGRTNGTTYYVAVTTLNKSGFEDPAVSLVAVVPIDDAAPEPPTDLAVTHVGADSLQIAFTTSANTSGDLAGYALTLDGAPAGTIAPASTAHTITGLAPASKTLIGLAAYDALGNHSAPATLDGYTLVPHPSAVTAAGRHQALDLNWTPPPAPLAHVLRYNVYVETAPFSDVAALTPRLTALPTATAATVTGLVNGQTYHVAVTTLNRSLGQDPAVTAVPGTPVEDTTGPTLSDLRHAGLAFASGSVVAADGRFSVAAADPQGVSHVRFLVDAKLIGIDVTAADGFSALWLLDAVSAGPHQLTIEAHDKLANVSTLVVPFDVAPQPPPAPVIQLPAPDSETNQDQVLLVGTAQRNATVTAYLADVAFPTTARANAAGAWSLLVPLAPGQNPIAASATNAGGEGPRSAPITVTRDDSVPPPPKNPTVTAKAGGELRLAWVADGTAPNDARYHVYRAPTEFTDPAAATRLTATPVAATAWTDLTPSDARWYYRVTTVNRLGTASPPSPLASGVSDSAGPRALSIATTARGAFDPATARHGVGPVDVLVTFDEPLAALPFLSYAVPGGLPLGVPLQKRSATTYQGTLHIAAATPSGTALAVLSARDHLGNRGSDIDSGQTLVIDTDAPSIAALAIDPPTPVANDPDAPLTLTVDVLLDAPLPDDEEPALAYHLSSSHPDATPVALAKLDALHWTGGFTLPADAGLTPETLAFSYLGVDDLGNESTAIAPPSAFEVYQGALPALAAPAGLTATSAPGGLVRVAWLEVPGAAAYQLYRKGPLEPELTPYLRVSALSLDEDPGADGTWSYAVASVRQANQTETTSPMSAPVDVASDATAPNAPSALALELVGRGIRATWLAPAPLSEDVTYRLYRDDVADLTDVSALTPIATDIADLFAVDAAPSDSEHAYAVVAVDLAGNASPPSASAYLNAELFPVRTVNVVHDLGSAPTVSWTHPGADLAYIVSIDGDPIGAPISATTYTDDTFAADEPRTYAVRAVDLAAHESPDRALTLPIITVTPHPDQAISRGLFTPLAFTVLATTDVAGVTLVVRLGDHDHRAAPVDLLAGEPTDVTVVVGGYDALADPTTATLTLAIAPAPGESVAIVSTHAFPLSNAAAFGLDLVSDTFTRGLSGNARFVFTNPTDAEVELVTATQHGGAPSDEIRLNLLDADGNVYSTATFKQTVGPGLVTLSNGKTVARVAPGASFTSAPITLPVPANAPDTAQLRVTVDAVHHGTGTADHIALPGLVARAPVTLAEAPYYAVIDSVAPTRSYGDVPVVIAGRALDSANDQPVAGVPVKLVIAVSGFERATTLTTDAAGAFTHAFSPVPNEGGSYTARASFPHVANKDVQATFHIDRVFVGPTAAELRLAQNVPATLSLRVRSTPGAAVTNLRVAPGVLPTGITVDLPAPIAALAPNREIPLDLVVTGAPVAPSDSQFQLTVLSDERTWGTVLVSYHLSEAAGALAVSPPGVETGVARDDVVDLTFALANKGLASFHDVQLSLVDKNRTRPAPGWIFLASAASIAELAVGQTLPVSVAVAPTAAVETTPTTPYAFYLRVIAGGDVVADVPIYVWVDDSGMGHQLFKVEDIYTNTLDENGALILGVAGARIELDRVFGSTHHVELLTDAHGEALFEDVPTGSYRYRVSAPGHDAVAGNLTVRPGVTGSNSVFLTTPLVSVEWEVTETTIQDSYTIVLTAEFETDVPAPVVVAEPTSISIPELALGEVFYGQYDLVNHGLVRADRLALRLPSGGADYRVEVLATPPDSLEAKSRVTIPYRVVRVADSGDDGAASGGIYCKPSFDAIPHCYGWVCANGQWVNTCNAFWLAYLFQTCLGDGGEPTHTDPWVSGIPPYEVIVGVVDDEVSQRWRPPEPRVRPVVDDENCDECEHPELSSAEQECCKYNKKQETASQVDVVSGEYEDATADLPIALLGYDLGMMRTYDDGVWGFELIDEGIAIARDGGGIVNILHRGSAFSGSGTIFVSGDATITVEGDDDQSLAYVWRDSRGNSERYLPTSPTTARLALRSDALGRKLVIVRDSATVARLEDTFGTTVATWELDDAGRVIAIGASDGRRVAYTWTAGRLTAFTNALGESWSYTYDGNGRMTSKTAPNGFAVTLSYTASGNVASLIDHDGDGWYFDYGFDEAAQQPYSSVIATDGTVTQRWFGKGGELVKETVNGIERPAVAPVAKMIPDGDGLILRSETPDGVVFQRFSYDALQRRTGTTDPRGIETRITYDAFNQETRRVVGVGRPDRVTRELEHDPLGRLEADRYVSADGQLATATSYVPDDAGNAAVVTDDAGNALVTVYDQARRPLSITYPNGDFMELSYDELGRLLTRTMTPAGGGDPVTLESNTWDVARAADDDAPIGRTLTTVDAAGNQSVISFDAEDRPIAVIDAWGRTASATYDGQGREVRRVDHDGVVHETLYEVLDFGFARVTEKTAGEVVRVVETDAYDRVVREVVGDRETVTFYDGDSPYPAEIASPGLRELLTYDSYDGVVERTWIVEATGETLSETYARTGTLVSEVVDAAGNGKRFAYSALDQTTHAEDDGGNAIGARYDGIGRLEALVDGAGHAAVTLRYDAAGEVDRRTFADGSWVGYERDPKQRVTSETRSDGTRADYTYDVLDRLTRVALSAGADPVEVRDFAYDGYNRLVSHTNGEVAETITWDDLAQQKTVSVDFGPFSKRYTINTDASERVVALVGPDGSDTSFAWSPLGELELVRSAAAGDIALTRDTFSETTSYPNGVVFVAEDDALGRPLSRRATREAATLMDWRYDYDAHFLAAIATEDGNHTYSYDASDQLVAATHPTLPAEAFDYDGAGRRASDLARGEAPWSYDAAGRLTAIGANASFTWSDQGELTARTEAGVTTRYEYDVAGQLVAVRDGAGALVASYGYDALGRRTRKTVGAATTYYLWGPEGLLAEYDALGNELASYLWRPGSDWQSALLAVRIEGRVYYPLVDHFGTVHELVDDAGDIAWSIETAAFGTAVVSDSSSVTFNLRFSSQYYDAESGLHYNLLRYYDPALGRYTSRDPLYEHAGEADLYAFSANDPMRWVDRQGAIKFGGEWSTRGKGKFQGGVGVGPGEGGGGVEFTPGQDCCYKPPDGSRGHVIKNAQSCIKVFAYFEVGAQVKAGVASAKLLTLKVELSCEVCTKCAQEGTQGKCCLKTCLNGPAVSLKISVIKLDLSIGGLCDQLCYSPNGWKLGPNNTPPEFKFGFSAGK